MKNHRLLLKNVRLEPSAILELRGHRRFFPTFHFAGLDLSSARALSGSGAVFHGPMDLAHWVTLTVSRIAYGWTRPASRTTTRHALMSAAYNNLHLMIFAWSVPSESTNGILSEPEICAKVALRTFSELWIS